MKTKLLITTLILLITALIFYSCDTTEPNDNGDNQKPPGYQEDIPWPSLADSPWPMNHHDPQSTGRSQYVGPSAGVVEWVYEIPSSKGVFTSSAAIDLKNRILVGTNRKDSSICGYNNAGKLVWQFTPSVQARWVRPTPLIGRDGTIFTGTDQNESFYAINSDGKIKWSVPNVSYICTGINIGLDGTLYFTSHNGDLYAISQGGQVNWKLNNSDFHRGEFQSVVFSPDSKTLYVPSIEKCLYAVDIESQTVKWSFGDDNSDAAPLVDSKGNIYALTNVDSIGTGLYCLTPSGEIKWYVLDDYIIGPKRYQDPALSKEGNIYFGFGALYSVNYEGKLNWMKEFDGVIYSPIVCDAEGTVYIVLTQESQYARTVVAVAKDGTIKWETEVPHDSYGAWSPLITENNKLIIINYEGRYIYSIK